MAAPDMPLPQQPQQVEQGGHAPPDVPPSLQNKITRCSKRFEKQLADSDVTRTTLYMCKKDVESHILPLLEADEFRKRGIQNQEVTVYDIDGDEYPMLFKRCGRGLYNLNGEQLRFFLERRVVGRGQHSLAFLAFRNAESGRLCFFITSREVCR